MISSSDTASRCSQIASMCQLCRYGWPGSMICQAAFTKLDSEVEADNSSASNASCAFRLAISALTASRLGS